jgi:hypothetical protein
MEAGRKRVPENTQPYVFPAQLLTMQPADGIDAANSRKIHEITLANASPEDYSLPSFWEDVYPPSFRTKRGL